MAGPLAEIYSASDSFKRKLVDALRNPRAKLEQIVGDANDRAGNLNQMTYAAAEEGPGRGPATDRLARAMAESYNPAGIFIGPESKLWNPKAAFEATRMAAKSTDPKEIWVKTGTFKSPDGAWKQEIDDSGSKFIDAAGLAAKAEALRNRNTELKQTIKSTKGHPDLFPKELTAARRPLREEIKQNQQKLESYFGPGQLPGSGNFAPYAYEHQALYKAYPELEKVVVRQGGGAPDLYGSYQGNASKGTGQLEVTHAGLKNDPRSTATHEMQHAVQDIEGFGEGGTPRDFVIARRDALDRIGTINNSLSPLVIKLERETDPAIRKALQDQYDQALEERARLSPLVNLDSMDAYRRLAGEAEARAAQKRIDYSPEKRRQVFPLDDYDVSPENIIVRRNGLIEALRGIK